MAKIKQVLRCWGWNELQIGAVVALFVGGVLLYAYALGHME